MTSQLSPVVLVSFAAWFMRMCDFHVPGAKEDNTNEWFAALLFCNFLLCEYYGDQYCTESRQLVV